MDLAKIVNELKQEKWAIEEAILSLEHLAAGRGKRRGRPPAWMKAARERRQEGRGGSGSSKLDGRRRKTK